MLITIQLLIKTLLQPLTPAQRYQVDAQKTPDFAQFVNKYGIPQEVHNAFDTYQSHSKFSQFLKKHSASEELQDMLKAHNHTEAANPFEEPGYFKVSDTKRFVLKSPEISRVINSVRLRKLVDEQNLTHIHIPQKYFGKLGDQWFVVAQEINSAPQTHPLTTQQINQLATFAQETGYNDWHEENVLLNAKTGQISFIDTEDRSFETHTTMHHKKALKTLQKNIPFALSKEAHKHLQKKIDTASTSPKKSFIHTHKYWPHKNINPETARTHYFLHHHRQPTALEQAAREQQELNMFIEALGLNPQTAAAR